MRTYRPPRRLVVGLVAAIAIVLPTMPAFAAPGELPPPGRTPLDPVPGGALPLDPGPAVGPLPADFAPKPDTPYLPAKTCITPAQDSKNTYTGPLKTRPYAQDVLQIDQAHQFATGIGQSVAVIDTGVNVAHSFFQGRVEGHGDYVTDKNGTEDCDGHGTLVAGIIGANTNPDRNPDPEIGFNGMAPDVHIYSIRQTSANYQSGGSEDSDPPQRTAGTIDTLAKAVEYAAQIPGLAAINISLTGCQSRYSSGVPSAYRQLQAAIHDAVEKNIVVVAAAGNLDNDCPNQNGALPESVVSIPMPPWFREDVLSVASVDRSGDPSSFSIAGPWVSVAAPGERIISLSPANNDQLVNQRSEKADDEPHQIVGTSFAAPYVTGLVALIRQRFGPKLTARQIMHRIEMTAQHPAGADGRDYQVGYGMINPVAALTATIPGEQGIPIKQNTAIPARIDLPYQQNWTPTIVALAGTGSGLALLLITMFAVRTTRRNRERRSS